MFDTSLVHSRAVAAPRRFSLLAVSLAVHSAAILAVVVLTLASTQMPSRSPNQMELYRPAMIPTVPPPYGHPARARVEPAARPAQSQPARLTAPNMIPDETLPVTAQAGSDAVRVGVPGEGEQGPIGVPWGVRDSIGAIDTTTDATTAQDPAQIYPPGGEVRSARVLRRVEPRYPQLMVQTRMAAVVTVRCVVDKNGRVRDPEILQSSWSPFNESVLEAVRQWTFVPGTLRGEPVDTWFELTVKFVVR